MADYTGKVAVHETLTANEVDAVTLTGVKQSVTVVNRTGGAEIYVTTSATAAQPDEPTVEGTDTYVLPSAIGSISVLVNPGVAANPVVVKLISTGAESYSVEAL